MSISPSSSPPNSSRSEYVSPHFGGDVVPKITAGNSHIRFTQIFCCSIGLPKNIDTIFYKYKLFVNTRSKPSHNFL